MQVHNILEYTAHKYPNNCAAWFEGVWKSYREVNIAANKLASFLLKKGILKGDRVALVMDNSINYIICYFAILKAGAVVVGLNPELARDLLDYQLTNSAAKLVILEDKYIPNLQSFMAKSNGSINYIVDQKGSNKSIYPVLSKILKKETPCEPVRTIDQDLAEIVYTSGSTGKPKGVMLTHLNLVTNMHSIVKYLKLKNDDRIMVILPFYYIYGKSLLLTHFLVGGAVVIDNRFTYPNTILMTMKETMVTGLAGVPSTFSILLNRSNIGAMSIRSLRYITQAGGGMAPAVQKEVVKAFSPAQLYIMYGATEAAPRLSYLEPDMLESKLGSIGKAVDNVELTIVDEKGHKLPPGEEGEIAARGSNIMKGYWRDPAATQKVLVNGYYLTGDLGVQDEDGYFYVVGRKKNFIKTKGYKVSAKIIEDAIMEMSEVQEVAVTGVKDEVLGEAVKAYIKPLLDIKIDPEHVRNFLKSRLAKYEIPKHIVFVDSLPKNRSGKILKTKLA